MYDIIIIGCGPAGMTAAIYARRSNKTVLILEKEGIGGQIASAPNIENYPGFKKITGSEFANNLYEQVTFLDAQIEFEDVLKIEDNKTYKTVITQNKTYKAKSIIIATGCKAKLLSLDNEQELLGNGIHFCASCDGAFYKNKIVAVAGGGNSALESALNLAEYCQKVYLIHRRDEYRAEETIVERVKDHKKIEQLTNSVITSLNGRDNLESIDIKRNELKENIKVEALFLFIGQIPQLVEASGLEFDENKYIKAQEDCKTKIEGVFVAGDIRSKKVRQITTSVSDGTVASINACSYVDSL